jgi:hypothetical protein
MKSLRRIFLPTFLLITSNVPAITYAQGVTTYDGTYIGVSLTGSGRGGACVPSAPVPRPLTIKNGAVQWGAWQGTVTAQGAVSAKESNAANFNGRVEAGRITGTANAGGDCNFNFVWQKQ